MNSACRYEIHVQGHMTERWADWFDGLAIGHAAAEETTLTGTLPDQAALLGVLNKIHALNLTLLSLRRLPEQGAGGEERPRFPAQ